MCKYLLELLNHVPENNETYSTYIVLSLIMLNDIQCSTDTMILSCFEMKIYLIDGILG